MKKLALSAALLAGVSAAMAQDPIFRQVANITLSSFFITHSDVTNIGAHGTYIGGIASDGTNIFVSGWMPGTGAVPSGIVRISNPLGVSPVVTSYIREANHPRDARISKLIYSNGALLWNIGGGASAGTTIFGVRRIVDVGGVGQIDTAFAGDGLLTPADMTAAIGGGGTRRMDDIAIDPSGRLASVGFFNYGSPAASHVTSVDPVTGLSPSSTTITTNPGSFRGFDFDAAGNLYARRSSTAGVQRSAAGIPFGAPTTLYAGTTGANSWHRMQAFRAGAIGYAPFLAFTGETGIAGDGMRIVITRLDGSVVTRLTGSEDGFPAFADHFLSTGFMQMGGRDYLLVGHSTGAGVDQLRIYEVVPEPGTMIALGAGLAALLARRRRRKS
jgi:hypothetical protein